MNLPPGCRDIDIDRAFGRPEGYWIVDYRFSAAQFWSEAGCFESEDEALDEIEELLKDYPSAMTRHYFYSPEDQEPEFERDCEEVA